MNPHYQSTDAAPVPEATQRIELVLEELDARITFCMVKDRRSLRRQLDKLGKQFKARGITPGFNRRLKQAKHQIHASYQRATQRAALSPEIRFDDNLPIVAHRDAIAKSLSQHQLIIVCGETGSGKSTQLPKLCLTMGRGGAGLIGHTQPRRVAARTLAARIAEELKTGMGHRVGYKVRFNDRVGPNTHIKLMTDGILLAEIQGDRWLEDYDTLIIDEAHERSLNIELILGYIKSLLPKRPELKAIITSATIDPKRFSTHFGDAPIIEVSGRTYSVEVRYRPLSCEDSEAKDRDLAQGIVDTVDEISREKPGDILVFLPGEREIRETAESLRKHRLADFEVLPLFSRLSVAQQNKVFQTHKKCRIVLATNVAETSLTVPGIRYVIDSGLARISRYNPRTKVQRLPIERISKASAEQRKGRCGRISEGVCFRLYSQEDYQNRPEFTEPEIQRTSLASVILKLSALRFGDIEQFPFIDVPERRYINDGHKLLKELGALDESHRLTEMGKQLARLPIDPRIGRILLAGREEQCVTELLIICAALSVQDPRERPADAQAKADAAHHQFDDKHSDFIWYLNLWRFYQEQARHGSKNKLRKLCQTNFLSYMRMREWVDIHSQLRALVHDFGFHTNSTSAEYDAIHRALLSGLLANIGLQSDKGVYTGARSVKFAIFPGSTLFRKQPKWVVAAELTETTKLYARTVAKVEPEWIIEAAEPLLRRSYHDPHWEKHAGCVIAYENATLYGLTLRTRRKVVYSQIDPEESRRLFIQSALVEGNYDIDAPFSRHNKAQIAAVRDMEHRARRLDILVDERTLYEFYDQRIPIQICSRKTFEDWRRRAEKETPRLLFLQRDVLIRDGAALTNDELFPSDITNSGTRLVLDYQFEPGAGADGITVTIPNVLLNQLPAERFDWLVPGLLHEKITALIRGLPKSLRRNFVPATEFAQACVEVLAFGKGSLLAELNLQLQRMTGIQLSKSPWRIDNLPPHLLMNFRVIDQDGRTLAEDRDLEQLKSTLGDSARATFSSAHQWEIERTGISSWDFADLPEVAETTRNGLTVMGFPTLIDDGSSVSIHVVDTRDSVARDHHLGLRRLFLLALSKEVKYLRKNLPNYTQMSMRYSSVGSAKELQDDLIHSIVDRTFIEDRKDLRSKELFVERLEKGRPQLIGNATEVCDLVSTILERFHSVQQRINGNVPPAWLKAVSDIRDQTTHLVYKGFISSTPPEWLDRLPRYFDAVQSRLDKLSHDLSQDNQRAAKVVPLWQDWKQHRQSLGRASDDYRWMLEEFRVSIFAQELGAAIRVSEKRLRREWKAIVGE